MKPTKEHRIEVRNAVMLGGLCSVAYLAVYLARNVLGAVSPQMIETGVFTTEQVGTLSSLYFITYAVGQLINGAIGDRIKAKYMISLGLLLAGLSNVAFSLLSATPAVAYAAYGCTGFFLSMIYGPMTKVVAENVKPLYATRCSLGYTFASFLGSPLAGALAAVLAWQPVFYVSSIALVGMAVACFLCFCLLERQGIVKYQVYQPYQDKPGSNLRVLLQRQIVKFTLISILTGVIRTTVVFWLPTYLSQHLGFPTDTAAGLFTAATVVISLSTFVAIFVYERLHHNMDVTILLSFIVSAIAFGAVYLLKNPTANISCLVLAILASNCAATMLWSRYCPSLRDTGMVSSATGFLDFVSYMAASISSTLFANAVDAIGWGNLILIWSGLMVVGVIVALPYKNR